MAAHKLMLNFIKALVKALIARRDGDVVVPGSVEALGRREGELRALGVFHAMADFKQLGAFSSRPTRAN